MIIPSNRTVPAPAGSLPSASIPITTTPATPATTDASLDISDILTLLFGIVASFTAFIAISPIVVKWRASRARRSAEACEGDAASSAEMQTNPEPASDELPAPPAPYGPPSVGRPTVPPPADGSTEPWDEYHNPSAHMPAMQQVLPNRPGRIACPKRSNTAPASASTPDEPLLVRAKSTVMATDTAVSDAMDMARDAAACVLAGSHGSPLCSCSNSCMPFSLVAYRRLLPLLDQDSAIALAKLLAELHVLPGSNPAILRFKMRQGTIHGYVQENIGPMMRTEAKPIFDTALPNYKLYSLGQCAVANLYPDCSWSAATPQERPVLPHAILEVSHTNPKTEKALGERLQSFIMTPGSQVRLAVGIKIPYHNIWTREDADRCHKIAAAVLDDIDRCVANACLKLFPSDFVGDATKLPAEYIRPRRYDRSRPAPIQMPLRKIESCIREAADLL
ncbi:hypothetical protein CMUS01_04538 [Colletotrichum musicola]|uniref:Uncharacterized protein n=1 Tax=Colletotrichum musicola TaxID=2175873 RepID=A0A8H6KVZ6_9PEZI|nr:hypothetical protein CMUS01_04538 [Colletotrichum musicola]